MRIKIMFVSLVAVLLLSACSLVGGSSPVTVNDIPVFPGATELKAGDTRIGDTLAKNSAQSTALGQAAGTNSKTEQKGFALPKDSNWDAIKKFYDDKLKSSGWGDAAGGLASSILSQVNTQNDAFQTTIYSKGNQTLSVIRVMTDPTTKETILILSLSSR